jgi:hypothetical protein
MISKARYYGIKINIYTVHKYSFWFLPKVDLKRMDLNEILTKIFDPVMYQNLKVSPWIPAQCEHFSQSAAIQ